MAKNASSSVGGVIGLVLGFVVLAGIAGTPFYLASLQSDTRALDGLVHDDVEVLRRVVLNLNTHLDQMATAYRSVAAVGQPADPKMGGLLKENEALLQQAETVLKQIPGKRVGEQTAGNHLAVNRMRAIFYLTAARMDSNRGQYEEAQAETLRRAAELRLSAVAALRRSSEAVEARTPTEIRTHLEENLVRLDAEIAAISGQVDQLSKVVTAGEARVAEHDQMATETRRRLAELERNGLTPANESEYLRLSNVARAAEAEAEALRNGTLAGARPVFQDGEDWVNAAYDGGQPQLGLRDLKFGLELLSEQITLRQQMKSDLVTRRNAAEEAATAIEAHKRDLQAKIDAQISEISELLVQAGKHAQAGAQAREEALATLERKAAEFTRQAFTAAEKRTRDAAAALRDLGEASDERLQRVSKDTAMAGSLQGLAAEVAYQTALIRLNELNAMESAYETDSVVARLTGREAPADISTKAHELRTKAAVDLKTAMEKLDDARNRIKTVSVRAADGTTVSGSNFVWAFDVGQAAIRLLEANLAGDKAARIEAQKQAYLLLTEAAKDREQSPLLTPAIDAIRFLQDSVTE